MSKSFSILKKKMSRGAQKSIKEKTIALLKEMPLQELRQARHISQEQLARTLFTKQANVSRMERRTDMYISSLRSIIEAMGGELEITARFPDGDVQINQFKDIDDQSEEESRVAL